MNRNDARPRSSRRVSPTLPAEQTAPASPCRLAAASGTNYFCPVCGHEFLPEEIGKKPHCRRCGYLESCCNPD